MNRALTLLAAPAMAVVGVACSPALDWREFVAEGSDLTVTFPCRPDRQARAVAIAGTTRRLELLACKAGGATYAVAFAGGIEPARITQTLAELGAVAIGNVAGRDARWTPWTTPGMTPNPLARRLAVAGRLPDGAAVQEHAAFFTRGARVYQATVIGAKPAPQAVETFFGGLKFAA